MGRRAITPEFYDQIVSAFRVHGANFTRAAEAAGISRVTATKAYEKGWPKLGFPSVRKTLLDEQAQARQKAQAEHAARLAQQEREREQARQNAIQAHSQEAQMITLARTAGLQGLVGMSRMVAGAVKVTDALKPQLEKAAQDVTAGTMSPGAAINLVAKVAQISESLLRSARAAMEMQRLHIGSPTDIVAHVDARDGDLSMEDVEIRLKAFSQAVQSTKRMALLESAEHIDDPDAIDAVGVDMGPGAELPDENPAKVDETVEGDVP